MRLHRLQRLQRLHRLYLQRRQGRQRCAARTKNQSRSKNEVLRIDRFACRADMTTIDF
jgi:hypothetical protein